MIQYKLLTPGPLTTTESVKKVMMEDHCTWDDDYKQITQKIRKNLLKLAHVSEEDYTVVLMQGSGSFGVESVLTSVVGEEDKLLIVANGAYGERMTDIADHAKLSYAVYRVDYDQVPSAQKVEEILKDDPAITHVAMVHSETTSGILNDIASVSKVVKAAGKTMIVDAMSSFAGVDIQVEELGIDFLISSANKCIQGVPGFSFILCNRKKLIESQGKARSLSLDLYDQWKTMEKDGKWRFTSPTHTVLAFAKAMEELEEEGGIQARSKRYYDNNRLLIQKMKELGIRTYIGEEHQGPIITTFFYPEHCNFSFQEMYEYIKERGYAIYPGKVTDADTFRIGNIGEIYEEDILKLCGIFKSFFDKMIGMDFSLFWTRGE
ncbi:2-aminoethylphosphonate--pyruvate transaminase [Blautia hydrogenotrophica]|uniref:2-aminoethylphosphonate--pyruvate transaminase n=1 Tax=Blautia hydrogenotrophica TaxID=53443 RepID=UPI002943BEFC|nr:2-aminoethylphosphonate--pyruvate transaminase [Blautia hydrogenotrophica]